MKKITPLQIAFLGVIGLCAYLYWDNRRQKNQGSAESKTPVAVIDTESEMSNFVTEEAAPVPVVEKVLTQEEIAEKEKAEKIEQFEREQLASAIAFLEKMGILEKDMRNAGKTDTFIISFATERGWQQKQFK